MRFRHVTVLFLAAVLTAPVAAADHIHEVHEVETDETDEVNKLYLVVDGHTDPQNELGAFYLDFLCPVIQGTCFGGQYATEANVQVWEESNGCDGLQERSTDCDGDREYEDSDTHHQTAGCVSSNRPCGLPLPIWGAP